MIIPTIHRIIVKADRLEEVDKTHIQAKKLGIVIPEHEDKKRAQAGVDKGVVVSIGPTAYRDYGTECPFKPGDYVAWARFGGKIIEDPYTEEEFVALNDEDIIVIFKKEEANNG